LQLIQDLFSVLYGKYCWNASKGYGSFLTFEFGTPSVEIYQPTKRRPKRRTTAVHGEWHLWVYMCDWKIYLADKETADSASSTKIIRRAMLALDGQALTSVAVTSTAATTFCFDLEGRLETYPNRGEYGDTSEQWLLYQPNGMVFTLRADRMYGHNPGTTKLGEENWLPLFE